MKKIGTILLLFMLVLGTTSQIATATEDITTDPMTFALNRTTITDWSHADYNNSSDTVATLQSGQYVEYTVNTTTEQMYKLTLTCGTKGSTGMPTVDVSVNGTLVLDHAEMTETESWSIRKPQELGYITLKPGENVIKFHAIGGSLTATQFSLSVAKEDITSDPVIFALNNTTVDLTHADAKNSTATKITLQNGQYFEYTVNTLTEQMYKLTFTCGTKGSTGMPSMDISINGTLVLDNAEMTDTGSWGTRRPQELGNITLKPGTNVIRFKAVGGSLEATQFSLSVVEDYLILENFEMVTAEGARLPYAVRNDFTAYAKVDVKKAGDYTGKYLLMLAQYAEDTSLVGISVEEIDVSQMADKEKKTFTAPLTYKGNGGWVKAFLLNKETMAPLENCLYVQDVMYFSKDVLEEQTSYTKAENVTNGAGEYYTGYDIDDGTYKIDAIFYDSVVGDQSKVFAYIGVPKGASEANPVPAVVCVHGGGGVAFPEWVKIWNDKGYAAIAMTLTGDGPDVPSTPSAAASAVGQYPHPYMGVTCWGGNAFLADVESAGMYQNVLNVIRAHNVLRSYPGVDETKTGITGISWGGVTTTTVIGVDDRFQFAVPVYGTGYLDESETYFSSYFTPAANTVEWDPANFAAHSTVPTLYINSDSDKHFSVNSTTKTAGVTKNSKISIHHNFSHGFPEGWGRPEIYAFADAIVNNGTDSFITISEEKAENGVLTAKVAYPAGVSLASVTTYYITEEKLPYYAASSELNWKSVTTYTTTADGISVSLPSDATFCYASLKDNNGNIISTKFIPVA